MSTTVLTLREVKKILAHTEDTKHSITEFIAFFAKNPDLNAVYSGGKLKALNASRVFGGYLSGALKIEASKWDDLRDVFHKMPEEVSAVIAMGGDVLVGLNNLKTTLDANTEEARSLARANGKAHTAALASMTRAREAFTKAGMPAQAGIVALEKEIELLISLLEESRANEKVAA